MSPPRLCIGFTFIESRAMLMVRASQSTIMTIGQRPMRRASHLLPIIAIVLMFGVTMFASASATTITFSGLTGANGTPVETYTEGGFTVTSPLGQFFQGQLFGNPIPSLFAGPLLGSPMNDALDVTRNG